MSGASSAHFGNLDHGYDNSRHQENLFKKHIERTPASVYDGKTYIPPLTETDVAVPTSKAIDINKLCLWPVLTLKELTKLQSLRMCSDDQVGALLRPDIAPSLFDFPNAGLG